MLVSAGKEIEFLRKLPRANGSFDGNIGKFDALPIDESGVGGED